MHYIRFTFALCLGVIFCGCAVSHQIKIDEALAHRQTQSYHLERVDDFDGHTLDEKLWSRIDQGGADWCRHMSLREDLVEIKEGHLYLYGKKNDNLEEDPRPVLTGGISSQGKCAITYGKVEIRCKLQAQQGAWPAIWMLPDTPHRGWPADGEIDILERVNFDPFVYQTVHSSWTPHHRTEPPYSRCATVDPDTWNVYGLEWTSHALIWTINGTPTHIYPKINDNPDQYPWTVPFYLLIDMQLGGAWAGPPDESTLPTHMIIDWVKFYSLDEK